MIRLLKGVKNFINSESSDVIKNGKSHEELGKSGSTLDEEDSLWPVDAQKKNSMIKCSTESATASCE